MVYRFDSFELDARKRLLLRDGQSVQLTSKAFDLLLTLIESGGREITKEELMGTVWRDQMVEDANLTVTMSALRKALGEKASDHRFIVTIPGRGYRFVGEMQTGDALIVEQHTVSQIVIDEMEEGNGPLPTPVVGATCGNGQAGPSETDALATAGGDNVRAGGLIATASAAKALPAASVTRGQSFWQSPSTVVLSMGLMLLLLLGGIALWRFKQQQKSVIAAVPFAQAPIRQLTTKGRLGNVTLSPDGKLYAYALSERGEYKHSLWLGQIEGGNDIQLLPPDDKVIRGIAFSPDSRTLYFSLSDGENSKGGFFKIPVLGGVVEKLSDRSGIYFALSPDGKQIAFFHTMPEKGVSGLFIANLDGTGEREVLTRPLDKHFYSIAPAWSPDGSRLAVGAINDSVKQSEEVFVVRVSDGQTEQLTALDWIRIRALVWRRSDEGLIAVAMHKSESIRHLWHIEYPSGKAHRLSPDTDSFTGALSISADGNSLLSVQVRRESNIWLAPAGNLVQAKQITFSSVNGIYGWNGIDWAPDNRIVFMAGVDRHVAIYSMAANGSDIRQITSGGFYDQNAKVTPDGAFVVFGSNRSGNSEVWRVRLDGSDLQQLTTGGGNIDAHPTADSRWIIYRSTRDGKSFIRRISISGGESTQVTGNDSSDANVSHDGKFIACDYKADDNSRTQLALVSLEDGKVVHLFDVPRTAQFNNGIRFTPDDKAVCYRDVANGIWRQELTGGKPTRLAGLPEEKIYTYGWSFDGKLFAFTRGREFSDAVLLRDFR